MKLRNLQRLQSESEHARETILEQLREAKEKLSEMSLSEHVDIAKKLKGSPNFTKLNQAPPEASSILRREFKIAGQIGEPGQHDKLTYVSLIHQLSKKGILKKKYLMQS